MNRLFVFIFAVTFILTAQDSLFAQGLIQNREFSYIPVSQGRAILMKEIPLAYPNEPVSNYNKLKTWVKENYTTDLLNSGIKYNASENSVYVSSKVELLLPLLDVSHVSAKAVMNYYLDVFLEKGKCVVLFSDITYKLHNTNPPLTKKMKAEEFVTNEVLLINDEYKMQRNEVQKGTLHFFNNLVKNLEAAVNRPAVQKNH